MVVVALLNVATAASAWPALARDVQVALREDGFAPTVRETLAEILVRPAGASAIGWAGSLDALRQHAFAGDILAMTALDGQTACDQGLLEKLDWAALGGRDHYLPLGTTDCTVGAVASAIVLAWDHDKLATAPNWGDFWDVAKIPGKRGLARGAQGNLEIALMADGVAPSDLYRVLRGSDGVARAFRKLDQLKPYLVFWTSGAEAARILGSGDVLMTSGPDTAFIAANRDERRSFVVQWAGNLTAIDVWGIPKGVADLAGVMRLLAALVDPHATGRLPGASGLGGLARGSNDGLPADQAALSPSLQANLDRGVAIDEAFWRDNRERLAQQFDAWLVR